MKFKGLKRYEVQDLTSSNYTFFFELTLADDMLSREVQWRPRHCIVSLGSLNEEEDGCYDLSYISSILTSKGLNKFCTWDGEEQLLLFHDFYLKFE